MSHFEKIASVFAVVLVVCTIIFSYHEVTEPRGQNGVAARSSYEQSIGQNFKITKFDTVATSSASGGAEEYCAPAQSTIVAALHDIKEHLEADDRKAAPNLPEEAFEVNAETLQLFCNINAQITLSDADGNMLVLKKEPFTRAAPQGGDAEDIGTEVRINASLIPKGAKSPTATTSGDVLIPDRYLDTERQ